MRARPVDAHVGRRIRLRRNLMGVSQHELAQMIGVTFQQIHKYEQGQNCIGASRLFDLARALDVPIGFFFEEMPPREGSACQDSEGDGVPADLLRQGEMLDLVRAYRRIERPATRQRILALIRTLVPADQDVTDVLARPPAS
jgi:transcriptional regulator with XRE-family HTH domain